MKFGRYLAENLTPEWKRAYIDYRGCKKKIKVIQKRLDGVQPGQSQNGNGGPETPGGNGTDDTAEDDDEGGRHRNETDGGDDDDEDDDDDSSDNGDYGPSRPPKHAASVRTGDGSDGRMSRTGTMPRSGTLSAKPTPAVNGKSPGRNNPRDYGSMSSSPRNLDNTPPPPPHLDLGEPSVTQQSGPKSPDSPFMRSKSQRGNVSFRTDPQTRSPPPQDETDNERSSHERQTSDGSSMPGRGGSTSHEGPSSSQDPLNPNSGDRGQDKTRDNAEDDQSGISPVKSPRLAKLRNALSPRMQATGLGSSSNGEASPAAASGGGGRSLRESSIHRVTPMEQRYSRTATGSMALPSPAILSRHPSQTARTADTFDELYPTLEQDEKDFFDFLDDQLEKVDKFYVARQTDATRRAHDLRSQLRELAEHRKLYHELYPENVPEWEQRVERYIPGVVVTRSANWAEAKQRLQHVLPFKQDNPPVRPSPGASRNASSNGNGNGNGAPEAQNNEQNGQGGGHAEAHAQHHEELRQAMLADKDHVEYNPEKYRKYKAELRRATLEFYRELELIKNYRILNITGFRKALKKFEKVTNVHCMELYTDDKIGSEAFAQPETVDRLLKETEELFTVHFENGNAKKARNRLRRQDEPSHSHYVTTFRSGLYLGVGMSAALVALVRATEPATQAAIPAWDALLIVYGGIFIPVIFACLFELNLDAFVSARINYEFVMELSKPTLDYRSYLEMPAFLFMTLSVCMYFSFHLIGAENVAPTTWPAAWLVFLAVFFLNPLPIFRRRTRYWFLRVLFRVLTPGISRVEFIAFFVADELNSLVFSIQDIMFLSCAYGEGWPADTYGVCHYASEWPYILISIIPALCRFIQCLKRYHDSRLTIHLFNAGKYTTTMLQYTFYILWRQSGGVLEGPLFITWVVIAVIYSIYNCAWDFVVDWSLLRPQSWLLRPDLGYGSPYFYYFAMWTNLLLRFYWVWYLPNPTSYRHLRSFIFGLAEMLRRWQWNFFRVETEHLGNADAYRVTREIPLPYRRTEGDADSDDDGQGESKKPSGSSSKAAGKAQKKKPSGLSVKLQQLVGGSWAGRGAGSLNVGARGHAMQREYEARRPGDLGGLRARSRSNIGADPSDEV